MHQSSIRAFEWSIAEQSGQQLMQVCSNIYVLDSEESSAVKHGRSAYTSSSDCCCVLTHAINSLIWGDAALSIHDKGGKGCQQDWS